MLIGIIAAIWFRHWLFKFIPAFPTLTGCQVIFFALASAFTWVEVLKWGSVRPFNCVKCLTGWFALILAFIFHVECWYMYLPVGLFVGAMFEGIRMRCL